MDAYMNFSLFSYLVVTLQYLYDTKYITKVQEKYEIPSKKLKKMQKKFKWERKKKQKWNYNKCTMQWGIS